MISIIISTADKESVGALCENISETIGVRYELIIIENPGKKYGLAKAYNIGGEQARFPYLCFMHDDVRFLSKNWGKQLIPILENPETGLVGLAGGVAKTKIPGDWHPDPALVEMNFTQHYKYSKIPSNKVRRQYSGDNPAAVIAIDGVWICVRRKIFGSIKFDEVNFSGFHGYDIDYSLQVAQLYQNKVTFDVEVEHFSEGHFSREWIESAIKISEKFASVLPMSCKPQSTSFWNELEKFNLKILVKHMTRIKFSLSEILQLTATFTLKKNFKPLSFMFLISKATIYQIKFRWFKMPI